MPESRIRTGTEPAHILSNNWCLFGALLCLAYINIFTYQSGVMTRDVFSNLMADKLDTGRIEVYYEMIVRLSFWNYALLPLFMLMRFSFVALVFQVPFILKYVDIPFNDLLRVVMISALPLFIGEMLRTIWFLQIPASEITRDTLAFVPFSVQHLASKLDPSIGKTVILNQFNIGELAWIVLMVIGMKRISRIKNPDVIIIVTGIWSVMVVFQWLLTMYLNRVIG